MQEILYPDMFWEVNITWSRPCKYESFLKNGSSSVGGAKLYKVTGRFGKSDPKLFYLGKTYKQKVTKRLTQQDHKDRYNNLRKEYPRHQLYVSLGVVELDEGRITATRIDQIESLLIFAHDEDHIINIKNINEHKITEQYRIYNRGYKSPLLKEVLLGVLGKE